MCFVRISEQTTIISLYNVNQLIFITETESVYCAVRTGSLYTKQTRFVFKRLIYIYMYIHTYIYARTHTHTHTVVDIFSYNLEAISEFEVPEG
jgi:hypothetical protein